MHVAYLACVPGAEQADLFPGVQATFRRVQEWVQGIGLELSTLLHIGTPVLQAGRLVRYECCVEVPAPVQDGLGEAGIQDLPGGRYAVLSMEKDPAVIGPSIGRLYGEYLSQAGLQVDARRPTYEIYFESTMEYCVPAM